MWKLFIPRGWSPSSEGAPSPEGESQQEKKTIISHIGRSAMQDHFTSPLYENPMKGDESSSDSSSCHHCQHRRRISCWTVPTKMQLKLHFRKTCHVLHFYILCPEVLSLLAVDLFTILLIFVIATQSNQMPMGETFEFWIQNLIIV